MKTFKFLSLILGLVLGSFAFVACGDDDDDSDKGGQSSEVITIDELVGTWYLVDENSSEKVCIDIIQFIDKEHLLMTEMKAKAKNRWEPEIENPTGMTFTFDGKTMKFEEKPYSGDITKENGKYMIQRYENGQAVGGKTDLIKVKSSDEAAQAFFQLIETRRNSN